MLPRAPVRVRSVCNACRYDIRATVRSLHGKAVHLIQGRVHPAEALRCRRGIGV